MDSSWETAKHSWAVDIRKEAPMTRARGRPRPSHLNAKTTGKEVVV